MADVHVHDVLVAVPVRAPNGVDDLPSGEGLTRVAGQRIEEVELARVRSSSTPANQALRARGSIVRAPNDLTSGGTGSTIGAPMDRGWRNMARTRAISSRGENGLTR